MTVKKLINSLILYHADDEVFLNLNGNLIPLSSKVTEVNDKVVVSIKRKKHVNKTNTETDETI